jgi:hypothetical protein
MWTSKLYVDPAHVAHADNDIFATWGPILMHRIS